MSATPPGSPLTTERPASRRGGGAGRLAGLGALVPVLYALVSLGAGPPDDDRGGGATTVDVANSHAFSLPAPNLDSTALAQHLAGDRVFDAAFVTAPAEVQGGLGPRYSQNACVSCHVRDGRSPGSLVLRVSLPGEGPHGAPVPVPGFGTQIQARAVFGHVPEAQVGVAYDERAEGLTGEGSTSLRVPTYTVGAAYQTLPPEMLVSPRMARPVFGLGLLEAIPEEALHRLAAEQAEEGEVSGRVNRVWDPIERQMRAGRFGWKAGQASLLAQAATAFGEDMGLTTPKAPGDVIAGAPGDGLRDDPEVSDEALRAVAFYTQTLAVPARRRTGDPAVMRGQRLFAEIGCAACHAARLETGTLEGVPAVSGQTIAPYTDLLLHDMGDGLADGRPEFAASGREWRTPPLWGIGLTEVVNGRPGFLHDGRAHTLVEAVLWHGGEAEAAREAFRHLSPEERADLLAFLHSL